MFEKIGVYGVVLTAHVVLNGAKKTYTLKMGNDSNLLIVFYVQIMPDDFVMQLHRF
ncbi:EutP/PduV family microcompartment system protein [Escherichia coli]